jgi:flagellar hook-associated protein 2
MAYNMLSIDGINSFVNDWQTSETKKKVDPLTKKKEKWTKLQTAYTTIADKLGALKAISYTLQQTGNSSAFLLKKAASSNTTFADITSTSTAQLGSHSLRINQLAKSDTVISLDQTSTADSTTILAPGTHSMVVTSGDGSGGVLTSNIDVVFEESDFTDGKISNKKVIEKIQSAVNSDKAVVLSNSVTGSTASAGSFNIDLGGKVTQIDYTSGDYNTVLDSIASQINAITGITAEKIVDGANYQLKITATDSSKYLKIDGDTSGILSELNISADKVIGGAGLLNASIFSPSDSLSQLSLAAKKSGEGYKLLSIEDVNGGQALTGLGLNLGSSRNSFVQDTGGTDTPGFIYTTDLLNAKIEFNGISVERNSNSISDLIAGSTVNLKSLMKETDTTVNLSVASDSAAVTEKIQDYIKKLDEIYIFLREKSKSTKDEGRGLLVGDTTADTLLRLFTSSSVGAITGLNPNELNSLSKLGITFSVADGLTLSDASKLEKAIKEYPEQVEAIFNSENGVAKKIYSRIELYINAEGYLHKTKRSFDKSITYLDDRIKMMEEKIDKNTSDLRLRNMKSMSRMNALLSNQSTFIMSSGFYR